MVGQKNLLKQIDWMCQAKCFPRFSILVGENGKQEEEFTRYITKQLGCFLHILPDTKIDTIRDIITESYKIYKPMLYVLQDADNMSIQAKNSLLKVTEEPPNNAYFIMLLNDINNTLDTIKSRATIFAMEPYSWNDLNTYFMTNWLTTDSDYKKIVLDLSETPGDIDLLQTQCEPGTADKFYAYVSKVVDNIGTVNGSNSFKIADKVALKDETDKYDLRMFWKACCKLFRDKALDSNVDEYVGLLQAAKRTSEALSKLPIKGVNKQMLFDEWLLVVRKELR